MKAIVVSGYGQYTITDLAESLSRRGMLAGYVTGGYPTSLLRSLQSSVALPPSLKRLNDRGANLGLGEVRPLWRSEVVHQASRALLRTTRARSASLAASWDPALGALTLRSFQRGAAGHLRRMAPTVALVRAGFGGVAFMREAKSRDIPVVVDLSIVHPRVLPSLLATSGQIMGVSRDLDPFWRQVEGDVAMADLVLVNSDFVRASCVAAGVGSPIEVVPTVPDSTAVAVSQPVLEREGKVLKCVFAGTIEARKGVDTLLSAFESFVGAGDISLTIIGSLGSDAKPVHGFDQRPWPHLEKISRSELDAQFGAADILVFPSNAEGSARVLVEAARAGCYIVATPNAGAPSLPGISLIPPGDPGALVTVLEDLRQDLARVRRRGAENASHVRGSLTLVSYCDAVIDVLTSAKTRQP